MSYDVEFKKLAQQSTLLGKYGTNPFRSVDTALLYLVSKLNELGINRLSIKAVGENYDTCIKDLVAEFSEDCSIEGVQFPLKIMRAMKKLDFEKNDTGQLKIVASDVDYAPSYEEVYVLNDGDERMRHIDAVLVGLFYNVADCSGYHWFENDKGLITLEVDIEKNVLEWSVEVYKPVLVQSVSAGDIVRGKLGKVK